MTENPNLDSEASETIRMAIAVMTAWTEGPNNLDFAFAARTVTNYLDDSPHAHLKLLAGFTTLSGWLLVKLEEASGKPMREILEDVAKKVT
jgi:hypothetical protein